MGELLSALDMAWISKTSRNKPWAPSEELVAPIKEAAAKGHDWVCISVMSVEAEAFTEFLKFKGYTVQQRTPCEPFHTNIVVRWGQSYNAGQYQG